MPLFITLVLTSFLARFGYQMGRSPVLPLGQAAEFPRSTPQRLILLEYNGSVV